MEKDFFEVFPRLKVGEELKEWLEMVRVTKVACNPDKTCLRVYIRSERWIHKKHILALEKEILRQCFPGISIEVKVIEKFRLSEQYTPENFWGIYHSSMALELKNYNMLEYNLFQQAKIEFKGSHDLVLTLPDSLISHEKGEILVEYLEKVFCERCGMDLKVESVYVKVEESKYRKNSALQIQQEVSQMVRKVQENQGVQQAKQEEEEKKGRKDSFSDFGKNRRRERPADLVYGRDFDEESIPLENVTGEMGEVVIRGQVMEIDEREIRGEKTIFIFAVTDFTDSITVKLFMRNELVPEMRESIKKGAFLKLKGITAIDRFDRELTIASLTGIKKIPDFRSARQDNSPVKRIELHCHTKMSDMDGVTDAKELVKRAYEWGHKGIAITDHGVVQAFPEAFHETWNIPKDADFKVLYGMEAYLVDDMKGMVVNGKGQSLQGSFVVFDLETTGFSPMSCQIIEIGAVRVEDGKIVERFSTFVNPKVPIPFRIEQLTSINDSMVMDAPVIEEVLPKFLEFCSGAVMVAHNADFDMSFVEFNCDRLGIPHDFTYIDTVGMARFLLPSLNRFKLDTVAKALEIPLGHHHRAVDDAACTADIFVKFVKMLADREIENVDVLNCQGSVSENTVKKLPTYHAIILASSEAGRINLYKLVSLSHLKYYNRRPRVPKSVFEQHREGLIIGSACEAGELYQALLRDASPQEIARLVNFYDYLEIQPLGNNKFMIADEKNDMVDSMEYLK